MAALDIDGRLPLIQDADLKDKIVLVRVDHNVVKKGEIRDPYRIDATIGKLSALSIEKSIFILVLNPLFCLLCGGHILLPGGCLCLYRVPLYKNVLYWRRLAPLAVCQSPPP